MNKALVAVAGAGKTEWLANTVLREADPSRTIVLTYTTTNQLEDAFRIAQKAPGSRQVPKVMGWRSFVINEIVRPYIPKLYPNTEIKGISLSEPDSFMYLKGKARYFNSEGLIYPSLLGKVATDVIEASKGRAIKRIERLYDSIYIDEGQDLRGNDLCVLEALLKSTTNVNVVLDPRQSTLSTAQRDSKYKKQYECAAIINLYRKWENANLITVEHLKETWRFTPQIALFSDLIFEDDLGLDNTVSNVPLRGYHDGIYLIRKDNVPSYSKEHCATALAVMKSQTIEAYESINFGLSKGISRDDVVVVATGPIEKLLTTGKRLAPSSACGFYVAVTRARYSVAIAVKDPICVAEAMRSPGSIWKDIAVETL